MPTKPIAITSKHRRFISREIKAGHYDSEADVVRAGLDLLEKQKLAKQALVKEIQLGIDDLDAGNGVFVKSREELTALLDGIAVKAGVQPRRLTTSLCKARIGL